MNTEINIIELFKVLLRKWWVIVIVMIVGGGIAFGYSNYFAAKIYESRGMLYITNSNASYNIITVRPDSEISKSLSLNDIYASQRLATTYIEILKSDSFLSKVIWEIGVNVTPSVLRQAISISAVNETEILQIGVRNTNPNVAAAIVDAILQNANDEITRVIKGGAAEVIDDASIPRFPSSPNVMKNVIFGIILSLVFAVILVCIMNLIDDHVKSQEDLLMKYDVPVLGLIPRFQNGRRSGYYNYYSPAYGNNEIAVKSAK